MIISLEKQGGIKLKTAKTVVKEDISVVPKLQSKTAFANATITPDDGYCGLKEVHINVSGEMTWSGKFNENTNYYVGEIIYYKGSIYRCKKMSDHQAPTDQGYWEHLYKAVSGTKTIRVKGTYDVSEIETVVVDLADETLWRGEYNKDTDYTLGEIVTYGNAVYICIKNLDARQDPTDAEYWDTIFEVRLVEQTVTPSTEEQVIPIPEGCDGFSKITVEPIPSNYISDDATAMEGDVVLDKTFYADRQKKTGTMRPLESLGDSALYLKKNTNPTAPTGYLDLYFRSQNKAYVPETIVEGDEMGTGGVVAHIHEVDLSPSVIKKGTTLFGNLVGTYEGEPPLLQDKTVTPTKETQEITADDSKDGLSKVTVEPIPDEYIVPSGTKLIMANGTFSTDGKAKVEVKVGGSTLNSFSGVWRFKQSMSVGTIAVTQPLKIYGGYIYCHPPYSDGGPVDYDAVTIQVMPGEAVKFIDHGRTSRADMTHTLLTVPYGTLDLSMFEDGTVDFGEVPQEVSEEFKYWASVNMEHVSGGAKIGTLQEEKSVDITKNGYHVLTPTEGFDGVEKIVANVNVQPESLVTLSGSYTLGGSGSSSNMNYGQHPYNFNIKESVYGTVNGSVFNYIEVSGCGGDNCPEQPFTSIRFTDNNGNVVASYMSYDLMYSGVGITINSPTRVTSLFYNVLMGMMA